MGIVQESTRNLVIQFSSGFNLDDAAEADPCRRHAVLSPLVRESWEGNFKWIPTQSSYRGRLFVGAVLKATKNIMANFPLECRNGVRGGHIVRFYGEALDACCNHHPKCFTTLLASSPINQVLGYWRLLGSVFLLGGPLTFAEYALSSNLIQSSEILKHWIARH